MNSNITSDKISDKASDIKGSMDNKLNGAKSLYSDVAEALETKNLTKVADRVSTSLKTAADTAVTETVSFVRRYPMQIAFGAFAIGLIAAFWARRSSKSAE